VSTRLPPRLAGLVSGSKGAEEGAPAVPIAQSVTDEVLAVLGPVRERVGPLAPLRTELLDVSEIVRDAIEIAVARWDPGEGPAATVEYEAQAPAEPVLAQASVALVGAIVHAIENAVEAMPGGGRVRLRTGRANGHVLIAVEDSGAGVPDDLQQEAFTPLVSTKDRPHLGLGLPVIRSLVTRHGGSVSLSRNGGCTVLEIRLPVVERSESPGAPPKAG
jgi:signal transduction histidine kinase